MTTRARYSCCRLFATLLLSCIVVLSLSFASLEAADVDNWDSEEFSDAALGRLKEIGKQIEHPADAAAQREMEQFVTAGFACTPLRPANLDILVGDQALTIYRERGTVSAARNEEPGLVEAISRLSEPFDGAANIRVKFKLFRVELDGEAVATSAYYEAVGATAAKTIQQSSVWHCQWKQQPDGRLPLLESIRVTDYEEAITTFGSRPLYADFTTSVLGSNESYSQQLLHGVDYWRERLPRDLGPSITGHSGIAIGDVNGDGLDDVYLCRPAGLPNRLFVQNPNGTATDVSADSGVDWLDQTYSALFVDLDNDGNQDLVVATSQGLMILANDGQGHFAPKSSTTRRRPTNSAPASLAAADADGDGFIDVYVCVYSASSYILNSPFSSEQNEASVPTPYHDATNGGRNLFFRNVGDFKLIDRTRNFGFEEGNHRFSLAASWEDFDNDGDPDLYVANDFGRNNLYRNDDGTFVDVAAQAGVEDIAAGMSVSWGDYNRDGWMDLYVSNMFSSAGNRIAYQRQFKPNASKDTLAQFRRHARGNTLFENAGDGTFRDVSEASGTTMGRWAWGSMFIDFNNDGLEDLFVANGYVTQADTGDL